MSSSLNRPVFMALVVGALICPACGDSSARDGDGDGDGGSAPGDGDGDGTLGDGTLGDGDGDPAGDVGEAEGDGDDDPGDGDGDPPLGCGDGQLDPGEACDDGNNEPGDGCSAFCQLPGALIWERFIDIDDQQGDDVGLEVVVDAQRNIDVLISIDASSYLLAEFDVDGNFVWSVSSLQTDKPSLELTGLDELAVGGLLGSQGATRVWDTDGDSGWTTLVDVGNSGILGVAVDGQDFVTSVGYHSESGFLARYDPLDLESWAQLQVTAGSLGPVGVSPSGEIWAVRGDAALLERYSVTGDPGWTAPIEGQADHVFEELVIGGGGEAYLLARAADQSSFTLSKYDAAGALEWSQTHDGGGLEHGASGLALLPGGLVVAGYTNGSGGAADGLLSWYDANGGELAADVVLDNADLDRLYDVVVTTHNYAIAVGAHASGGEDSDLWIRKFEI
ncbi:myxococcus cysteine-rich repeat containing protein [Enhygromyxa salina]|uniref:Uncharacterized protein n=1 Tax=Enhygromyxa salina TaxID=215803 RepID=A0A2S9YI99_9BACT|nr:myxococcus cysteine-rich repeat containing protein [Enhygromyxa salina]PRQ04837.1 hypothetical protein ENSA7_50100 [Enhygromyxa salina]